MAVILPEPLISTSAASLGGDTNSGTYIMTDSAVAKRAVINAYISLQGEFVFANADAARAVVYRRTRFPADKYFLADGIRMSKAITSDTTNGIPSISKPGVDIVVPAFILHENGQGRKKINKFPRAVKIAVMTTAHVNVGTVILNSSKR